MPVNAGQASSLKTGGQLDFLKKEKGHLQKIDSLKEDLTFTHSSKKKLGKESMSPLGRGIMKTTTCKMLTSNA